MKEIPVFILLLCLIFIAVPVSASYTKTFDADAIVIANQSVVQDPTPSSVPWTLWIVSGFLGLALIVISLVRSKSQKMDYEINIILSVLAWPFIWYWAWGGITSVDYIVGFAGVAVNNTTSYMTQHILYSFWVLGYIGVGGCIFAAFVTALLISQYNLFVDNEAEAKAQEHQKRQMNENQ